MVRVRLISSDSIDFGLDDLQSDYLDDILKDFPDRDAAISVPFTSYTVLGFLKDVKCQYQNAHVLELRNLLGLRNPEQEEDYYDPQDDTNYEELEETQYLIKVELESNSTFSHLDQSGLESGEDEAEDEDEDEVEEEIANLQHQQSIRESFYEAPQDQTAIIVSLVPLPRDNEEGEERVQEANREEYADEQTIVSSNNFNETCRETNIEVFNWNYSEGDVPLSDVSSLVEDDVQDTEMEQCVYTELQDEILLDDPSDAAPALEESQPRVGHGLEGSRKLQVRFVDLGLECIQDVKKAKGRKRKRGKK